MLFIILPVLISRWDEPCKQFMSLHDEVVDLVRNKCYLFTL